MSSLTAQQNDLQRLSDTSRLRCLQKRSGLDFSSNDYLGLATSPRLRLAIADALERGVPIGSGGSRLLRGNDPEHDALECEAAAFFGCEAALFFSSGYAANVTLLSTLPQRGDLVIHDALVHASAHEGMRLGRAEHITAPHNDVAVIADLIADWRRRGGTGKPWIAVESLYSMDGDYAPLDELVAVADFHEAMLLIDEAHATGTFGAGGRGLAAGLEGRENVITLRTCGKALGCEGALLCGPRTMSDFLINRGRGFIFSTAPSPLMASAVRESLRILADEPDRRMALAALIDHAGNELARCGVAPTGSQIIPVIIGEDAPTMRAATALQHAGFDVRGIRPPTVPTGTARLRISLTLNVTRDDVTDLVNVIETLFR
jgi:8-amino-7-oxononanoate synthase